MNKILTFIVLLSFLSVAAWGQQEILMKSGKKITAYKVKIDDRQGTLFYKDKKGKVKWEQISDVFSLTREDEVHIIFYQPDCEDVCFKTDQMRDYLQGNAAADEKSMWFPLVSGIVFGSSSSFLLVRGGLSFLVPVPSAAYATLLGGIRPNEEKIDFPNKYQSNAHYKEGFVQGLRKRRAVYSILGGGIGIISGVFSANLVK
ncbi:MAG: hypothetical protein U9N85_13635 [Bacteroidota bacterium]|nr:hypothetical protein [Bacteroidota bacterium]